MVEELGRDALMITSVGLVLIEAGLDSATLERVIEEVINRAVETEFGTR